MNGEAAEAVSEFEQRLGYTFQQRELLERALTHKSFSNENREAARRTTSGSSSWETRSWASSVGELIYRSFPSLQEGALSKIKAHLVSANMLGAKGRALEIGRFPPDGSRRGSLGRGGEGLAPGGRLRGGRRGDLSRRRTLPPPKTSSGESSGPRSAESTSETCRSTITRRPSRRARRGWVFRCPNTGWSRNRARTTRRRSWWSCSGTESRSRREAGRPSARPSARPPRKRSRNWDAFP